MLRHNFSLCGVVACIAVLFSGTAPLHAGLVDALTNADLEDPVLGIDTQGPTAAPGWSRGGTFCCWYRPFLLPGDDNIKHRDQTVYGGNPPASSGTQVHGHTYTGEDGPGDTNSIGARLWTYQSIGTVEAGDMGHILSLSADGGIRSQSGHSSGAYTGTFMAAFREGTAGSGTEGTVLGSAASLVVTNLEGGPATLTNTGNATYTVGAGDIGKELFAVISSESDVDDFDGGRGFQTLSFVWDTAQYENVVPEPAAFIDLANPSNPDPVVGQTAIADGPVDLNSITIGGGNVVGGHGPANLGNITVTDGSSSFQMPINATVNMTVNVADGASLDISGKIDLNGFTLTKEGTGTLTISNVLSGGGTFVNLSGTISPGSSVPEPASVVLLGLGLLLVGMLADLRRRKQ